MKIAVVGAEKQTRHLAPYDDPSYEIWVMNEWANADWCKRWDVLFQLHKPEIYQNPNNRTDQKHWEFLKEKRGKPICMIEKDPLVPDSVRYPLEKVEELMGKFTFEGKKQKNIRMTLGYMLGLAALARVESVDIWGVELAYSAEYRSQQNNFAFWCGLLSGMGIPVNLHCSKGMFDKPYYGREEYMQEARLQNYLEGIEAQIAEARATLAKLEGARMLVIQMLTEEKESGDVQK